MLAVKENEGQPYAGIRDLFEGLEALGVSGTLYDYTNTMDKGHGQVKQRDCRTIKTRRQWSKLKVVVRMLCQTQTETGSGQSRN